MSDQKQKAKERRIAVLSRYPGQKIIVNGIIFRVLKIDGQRLSIQIEAPEDVEIDRPSKDDDAADRIRKSNSEANTPQRNENKKKR